MSEPIAEQIAAGAATRQAARPLIARGLAPGRLVAQFRRAGAELGQWVLTGEGRRAIETPAEPVQSPLHAPLVSVIVPCRDGAASLSASLRSLRRQSVRQWEAIVVDDGSVDGSPELIGRWSARDPRISGVRTPGLGVAGARNEGLARARGRWVLFLDCDDWLHRRALQRLLARAQDAGVITGGAVKVAAGGLRRRLPHLDLGDPFAALCCEGRIAIHSALVRTDLARRAGGFDPELRTSEDWDFWQRLARMGVRFVQIPQVVAAYRNTPGSLSKATLQVARDGVAVLRRGHGPDPRVADPHPAYAAGAPGDAFTSRACHFVLWCAARHIALGGEPDELAELLPSGGCDVEPASLGALMASGMADVLMKPERALGSRWPEFEPKLARLLGVLGPERERLQALTLAVIRARLNGAPLRGDRLDLARARAAPDAEIVQLARGGRALGAVALPALAPRGPASQAAAVAAQARRLPLREAIATGGFWRDVKFWTAALTGLARRLPPDELLDGRLRPALRQAAADALAASIHARLAPPGPPVPDPHQRALLALRDEVAREAAALAACHGPPPPACPTRRPALPRPAAGARTLPVLMYHRIAPDPAPGLERYCIAPEQFEAQLRSLRRQGYTTVTPAEVLRFLRFEAGLPARPVLLSFDDGYLDFYRHAWPALRRYGMTAVVYAVTGRVGNRAVWDTGDSPEAAAPLMDWAQLRTLAAHGIAVGSHSHTHSHMTRLPVPALYEEALRSRALLEAMLGRAPVSFCYPYGAHDPATERVIEECGYGLAFTVREDLCDLAAEPLRAPRLEIAGGDDLEAFDRKLRRARLR